MSDDQQLLTLGLFSISVRQMIETHDVEHKYWCVMYNDNGHISLTPSDGKPVKEGTRVR